MNRRLPSKDFTLQEIILRHNHPNIGYYPLRLIHTVRFFLIATAILLITTNGSYRTLWKCSHGATAKTLQAPIQPIMSKNKSHSQGVQCERALLFI